MTDSTLGKFVIDLEARIDKLESDLGRAAAIASKQAHAMQKSFEDGFDKIRASAEKGVEGIGEALQNLTGLSASQLGLGAIAAGLGEITKKAIETGDQLNKLSQKTGISVGTLSGLAYAAETADVPLDALSTSIAKFSKFAAEAANGSKEQAAAFQAMGVSVKAADGSIRPVDQLLAQIADKFKGYKDGAEKSALATTLFGKAGAQMIPFLNQGAEGLAKASAVAKSLGFDFTSTAENSEKFNDNLRTLGVAAVGLGNDIAAELLPSLISAEEHIISFVQSLRANGVLQGFASGIKTVVDNLDALAVYLGARALLSAGASGFIAIAEGASAAGVAVGVLRGALALLGGPIGILAALATGVYLYETKADTASKATDTLKEAIDRLKGASQEALPAQAQLAAAALQNAQASLKEAEAQVAVIEARQKAMAPGHWTGAMQADTQDAIRFNNASDIDKLKDHIATLKATVSDANGALADAQHSIYFAGEEAKKQAPNVAGLAAKQKDAADAARKLAEDNLSAQKMLDSLAGKVGGPYSEAASQYAQALDDAAKAALKFADDGMAAAKVQQFLADVQRAATERFQQSTDAQINIDRVVEEVNKTYGEQNRLLGLTGDALQTEIEYSKVKAQVDKALAGVMGPLTEQQQAYIDSLYATAKAHVELSSKAKLDEAVAKEWQGIWSQAGNGVADEFAKVLVEGGSLFDGLENLAKQTVEAIISYFAKLAIINPILNAIFGGQGGFSILPTLANSAFGGGGGIASAAGSAASGGGSGFDLMSPSTWLGAGKMMFSGFSNAASTFWGGSATNPASANFMGPPVEGQVMGPQYGGYSGGFQQAIGVAGAAYAGYSEFKNAGGGVGGVAGGLTYGAGTYALGAGISSAIAGTGFAAGVSGAFAAIPVAGWIAIAAMLVDKFSGGKLFGTAWQTNGATTKLSIGADGGSASAYLSQNKQGALFSGRKDREKSVDPGQDAQDAAQQFFDAIKKSMTAAAKAMGTEVAPVIAAGISTVTEYDKKGHATATKYVVDAIGKQWTEATADLAAMRVNAEAIISQVDVSAGGAASKIADQWRADAQKLSDGAAFLLSAQVDINKQKALWEGANLTDTTAEVQSLQQGNETLADTYVRLQQQTTTMRTVFENIGVTLKQTGADFVGFVDDLSTAAGGLQNLTAEWQEYYSDFYSGAEQAATNFATLHKSATDALATIGEAGDVTMSQFRDDFTAYLNGSPTAEGIQQWLAAAGALAAFTKAAASAQDSYNQFIEQFADVINPAAGAARAFGDLGKTMLANIAQANALAAANGKAGASAADIGTIITATVMQGAAAFQQLQSTVADEAAQLFGSTVDQLQARIDAYWKLGIVDTADMAKLNDAKTQQAKQNQATQATALLSNFGSLSAISGQTLQQLADVYGVPLDKLASILGTDQKGLSDEFAQQVQLAKAALDTAGNTKYTNELLADILAYSQGKPLPFSPDQLAADSADDTTATAENKAKPTAITAKTKTDTSDPVVVSIDDGNKQAADDADETNRLLSDGNDLMRQLIAALTGKAASVNRNVRGVLIQ